MKMHVFFACLSAAVAISCSPEAQPENKEKAESDARTPSTNQKEVFQTFYPSGKIQVNGFVQGEKRVDTWSSWYETGEKKSEAYYVDGLKEGLYRVWHQNGQIQIKGHYLNGEPTGVWESFDEQGNKISEKKYEE